MEYNVPDVPELVGMCLKCARENCPGSCVRLRDAYARLKGRKKADYMTANGGKLMGCKIYYEIDGQTRTLSEWSALYGINRNTVLSRLRRGIPIREALTVKLGESRRWKEQPLYASADGRRLTIAQWAEETGVNRYTLAYRLRIMGLSVEEAVNWRGGRKR